MSHACPSSIDVTNWPSFCAERSPRSSGSPVTTRKVKKPVAALATVSTAADAAATSRATSNSRRFGAERPHRQHERADHAGRAEVHEELGDGQAVADDGTGVLDGERRGAAAVREARERREERDGEEHGGAEHADGAGHRTSLDVARLRSSPRRAGRRTKGRAARAARPFGRLGCYLAAALSFEPADTLTE